MYRRSVQLLPFNNPFQYKVSVTNKVNSGIQMYRQSVQLLPLNNPFQYKVSVTNKVDRGIQMYRRSVQLLPFNNSFQYKVAVTNKVHSCIQRYHWCMKSYLLIVTNDKPFCSIIIMTVFFCIFVIKNSPFSNDRI